MEVHHIIQSKSLQVRNLLLQHGTSLGISNKANTTPLQLAICTNDTIFAANCIELPEEFEFVEPVLYSRR